MDTIKKILIGVGIIAVLTVISLALTAFVDNRIDTKTTTPIEKLTDKVDGLEIKVDIMGNNINSILYVICKDSLSEKEIEELKNNKLIK